MIRIVAFLLVGLWTGKAFGQTVVNVSSYGSSTTVPCGQTSILRDHAGNNNYSNSVDGYIRLTSSGTSVITLSGTYSTEANHDYIRIYAGSGTSGLLMAEYSGTGNINFISSPGQTITLRFSSNTNTVSTGFQINVSYSGACGAATSGTILNVPTSGYNTVICGQTATLFDHAGTYSDYGSYVDGSTVLENSGTGVVTLSGTYATDYNYDLIRIYSGNSMSSVLLASYSGTGNFTYTSAPGQTLTVRFSSDGSTQGSGFQIGVAYSGACGGSTVMVPATGSNTSPCGQNTTLYDHAGTGDYSDDANGYTVLQNANSGVITLSGTYNTEPTHDNIRIYNGAGTGGTLLATYSGSGTMGYTSCPGQTLTVRFFSDGIEVGTGFQIGVAYSGSCTTPVPAPTISSFTPASSCTATPVVITGTNFSCATAVKFGGTPAATFTVNSPTQITATPAASGAITVTTSGGTGTSSTGFSIAPTPVAPTIITSGPTTVCAGTPLTLMAAGTTVPDLAFTTNNSVTGGALQYQTFVPTKAGHTTGIYFYLNGAQSGTRTLRFYTGTGTGGTLLRSSTFTLGSNGWFFVPIPYTAALSLTPGNTYTLAISGGSTNLAANTSGYGVYFSDDYGFPSYRLSFLTEVTPAAGPGCQWQLNGTDIGGATAATYIPSATGTYTAKTISACGVASAASGSTAVTIMPIGQWLGTTANWNTSTNWCGGVPTASSNLIIPASGSVPFMPTLSGAGTANYIGLANGSLLTVASGGNLSLYGSLINAGTGTLNASSGTITLAGSAAQSIMPGFTTGTLIVSGGSTKTLSGPVTVNTQLSFSSGMLDVGSNQLTLGSGATIAGASATQYVRTSQPGGRLARTVSATPVAFPVGNTTYNPATLTNTGTSDQFAVGVRNQVLTEGNAGSPVDPTATYAVNRTWDVSESTPGGSVVTMRLQWGASQENTPSFDYTHAYIAHYSGSSYDQQYPLAILAPPAVGYPGTGPYSVVRTGITSFSPFVVASAGGGAPLPVELMSIAASNQGSRNQIEWTTGNERNLAAYVVERSTDAQTFSRMEEVAATGMGGYLTYDNAPAKGLTYYRLKMVDQDGSFAYSKTVQAIMSSTGEVVLYAAPNPMQEALRISVYGAQNGQVRLSDVRGSIVASVVVANGEALIQTAGLAAGTYFLHFSNGSTTKTIKVTKQ